MLDKIHTKLLDSQHFLPAQDRTVRQKSPSVAGPYSASGFAASEPTAKMSIFTPSGAKISASPFAAAMSTGSLKQGF